MFEEQYFCRTDVVHAFGTSPSRPRAGRGSRLAGPRPDDRGGAGGVAGPAVRAGRRPVSTLPQEYWDPESCAPPPGQDELTADELAGIAEAAGDEVLALDAASTGRRGPGQAGSARVFPGESDSRAAGFGTGMAWDVTPGCAQLAVAADAAVDAGDGPGDSFGGVADHELVGLVCAFDRAEAYMAARKLVAIAEVFRRNPEDGFEPEPGRMPAGGARVHPGPAGLRAGRVPGRGGLAADRGVAPGHPAGRDPGRAAQTGSSPGARPS